jgi:hypothetical protein
VNLEGFEKKSDGVIGGSSSAFWRAPSLLNCFLMFDEPRRIGSDLKGLLDEFGHSAGKHPAIYVTHDRRRPSRLLIECCCP